MSADERVCQCLDEEGERKRQTESCFQKSWIVWGAWLGQDLLVQRPLMIQIKHTVSDLVVVICVGWIPCHILKQNLTALQTWIVEECRLSTCMFHLMLSFDPGLRSNLWMYTQIKQKLLLIWVWFISQNVWLFLNVMTITSCRVTQKSGPLRLIHPITVYSDSWCHIRLRMMDASNTVTHRCVSPPSPWTVRVCSLWVGRAVYIMSFMDIVISEKANKAEQWGNWMKEEPVTSPTPPPIFLSLLSLSN